MDKHNKDHKKTSSPAKKYDDKSNKGKDSKKEEVKAKKAR